MTWQPDGTFKKDIPNARTYYTANNKHHDGKWLLLKGKASWGEFYNSLQEIISLLKDIKKESEPVYWSPGYQTWTCPGDHLYEQVGKEGQDWIQVKCLFFLNGEKV